MIDRNKQTINTQAQQHNEDTIFHKGPGDEMLRLKGLYESLLSYSPDLIWVVDLNHRIIYANNAFLTAFGKSSNEVVGRLYQELGFDIEFSSLVLNNTNKALTTLKSVRGESELLIKNERRIYDYVFAPVLAKDDSVESVSGFMRDITDKKQSENTSARFKLLSEVSSDVIWFARLDGTFVDVNNAATEQYGYSYEEFLSMKVADLRVASERSSLRSQMLKANSGGIKFETLHISRDGTISPVEVNANGADFNGERLIMAIVRDTTTRKEAEKALYESEDRRRLAEETGQVGIWDWNYVTGKTYWSEALAKFYCEDPTSIKPDLEFLLSRIHANDRERVRVNFNEVILSNRLRYNEEFRVVKGDGSFRWIESIASITRNTSGEATRLYGVNIDITDRKLSEEKIRLSENQLRLVTNTVPALIAYVDSNECYRYVNQKFTEWFARSTDEFLGKSIIDVVGSQAYRLMKPHILQVLSGEDCTYESVLNFKMAGARYVHVSYMPDIGVDGSVYGYYELTHDLTDLKRSQELLRSSEQRMAMMMDSLTDYAIIFIDTDGLIESWNIGSESIFGYSQNEITGRKYEILFSDEDLENSSPSNEMTIARNKGRASGDVWHKRKDGNLFFASGVMMPLFNGKELVGFAKIATDLTEKRRQADELQKAHDELEIRVKERTRELAGANLALVKEMEDREAAEQQRVDLLVRLVSGQETERRRIARDLHDQLGQRLTALRLKIASLKDVSVEHAEISSRVERLQEIAEQLDSEVSFLAWELRPSALDDLGLVEAVGAFVNEWSRHVEIDAEFHSRGLTTGRLSHDTETHLYRITQEALNNISKHANATNVTVLLEKRGDEIILIIEDDGSGINQVSESSKNGKSKGLGLIGMTERATLIDGNIEIESAPGKGTTIYVRIPISLG